MTAGYGLAGALLMYLFDPDRGRRRRKMARDRLRGRLRRVGRVMGQLWRGAAADAYGVSHRIVHLVPKPTEVADDETLRQRVESQLFRDRSVPKGDLSLTAEHGTIIVRGVLDNPLDVTRLEQRIRSVPGVRGVQNLLHPHGTPAPNKERSVNTPKELTTDR
jgi:hypothetical protein